MSVLLAIFVAAATGAAPPAQQVSVADFGAVPDDGKCDAAAIRAAIASAEGDTNVVLAFDEGVYNLKENAILDRDGHLAMLHLWAQTNWTLRGKAAASGDPGTTLEMNLALGNQVRGASHLDLRDNVGIAVENLILDQNPRFATAAEVIDVDADTKTVTIDVFEDQPHFDGMASFSANNWDLDTRDLIAGPPVTIGLTSGMKYRWSKVDGHEARYHVRSAAFCKLLKKGQGLSFHFNVVAGDARCIDAYDNEDVRLENIFVYNVIGMVMGAGDNRDMRFRRFHIKPDGPSLAVGPRDGIHISRCTGRLLMEDVYVKGVRWDPLVSYLHFVPISKRVDERTIEFDGSSKWHARVLAAAKAGSRMRFWSGDAPSTRRVSEVQGNTLIFTKALNPAVQAGTTLSPESWFWEEAIIRRCRVEGNYGTALVYESDNLTVEDSVFRNNAYSNIGLGPTSRNAGTFTRKITIRNNVFEGSTWAQKDKDYRGTITLFNKSPYFDRQAYHRDIRIEGNLFHDIVGPADPVAIHVKNATNVMIRSNRYENTKHTVLVERASTAHVRSDEKGLMMRTSAPKERTAE